MTTTSATAICTDTSALLPDAAADRPDIEVVPVQVTLDDEPFDEQHASVDEFYEQLAGGAKARTSQPSPGAFAEAYERLAERGARHILSIHLDGRMSGTTAAAELASRSAPVPVRVLDTGTASFGVGACVRAAAETLDRGGPAAEAVVVAKRLGQGMRNAFVAPRAPGGRVAEAPGWSVLSLEGGVTRVLAACDTVSEALEVMVALAADAATPVRAAVGHAGSDVEAEADALADRLARSPAVIGVERYRVGPAVGAHTGPRSFGLFWWPGS
jgi:DegV family protein with EDD domain